MSETNKEVSAKMRAEAEKKDQLARKLVESERRTPLQLCLVVHEVAENNLWKYLKTTYTKPEEWAEDIGLARSSFFMYRQARELSKDMPREEFLKFRSIANALWYGKLPKDQKTETMFLKAQKDKAEDFEQSVKEAQAESGHTPSDSRVSLKIRMYAPQRDAFEDTVKKFIAAHNLPEDDYGRALEFMAAIVMQDLGQGESSMGSMIRRLQQGLERTHLELKTASAIFQSEVSADEQLSQLKDVVLKAAQALQVAAGIELPKANPAAAKKPAEQSGAEAKANAEAFFKGKGKGSKKAKSTDSPSEPPLSAEGSPTASEGPNSCQALKAAAAGASEAEKPSLTLVPTKTLAVQ